MKKRIVFKAFVSVLLVAAVLIGSLAFGTTAVADDGGGYSKEYTTHDIAIVFDNSGSMYEDGRLRWSQALYAMEVFASMVDYENGDMLGIYPMGPISVGKGNAESADRLEISGKDKVKDIERIYCKKTSPTILQPAYDAYEYLKQSSADKKWLIVLTDGAFYYEHDVKTEDAEAQKAGKKRAEEKTPEWLNDKLSKISAETGGEINIQYIGFSEANSLPGNPSYNFNAVKIDSEEQLTEKLIDICNKIFQRNIIPTLSSDGEFDIDVSMRSLYAFVQGKGASINKLTGNGETVSPVNSTKLESSKEGGTSSYVTRTADVSGMMVEYGNCKAGHYKLDYNASDAQVFYEPDVSIKTKLYDNDGNEVSDFTQIITPGEYKVEYNLVDNQTGENISSSNLLGEVVFKDAVVKNGDNPETTVSPGGTVQLKDGKTSIFAEATYLGSYHITNEKDPAFDFTVELPDMGDLQISAKVEQADSWYTTGDHDNWKPITVKVQYKGKDLSDEEMKDVKLNVSFSPEIAYSVKPLPGESSFEVKVGYNDKGEYVEPNSGAYEFKASASITDEFGQETGSNTEKKKFEVQAYPAFLRTLITLLIILGIILLLLFILTRKAWPHKMTFLVKKDDGSVAKKPISPGESMVLVPVFSALTVKAKKNTTLMKKFGKKANIYVKSVKPKSNVDAFFINFIPYESGSGFCDPMGNPFKGVVGNNTQIKIVYNDGKPELDGEIKVNK